MAPSAGSLRAALIQTCASDVPAQNLAATSTLIREAAERGAQFALTPEVTNMVTFSRSLQAYRESFANKSDMLVLDPESEFFKYMQADPLQR